MNWLKKHYPILLCFLPFAIYILTASRTLPWGDGAEFYIAVRTLGIPHPSGYPLFILIGRLLYLLNTSPFLSNLLPGIFASLSVLFLYLIILRMTKDHLIGIILSLFFAFGQEIWSQSVAAEVYTLNLFFFIFLIYLLTNASTEKRLLPVTFFVSGLALTNHLTALLYVIPIFIFILSQKKKSIRYLPLALIPLTIYLYFPVRSLTNPILDLFNPGNLGQFVNYVSGKAFHYRTLFFSGPYIIEQLKQFLYAWWRQFLILIPVGFYGIFFLKDKKSRNLLIIILILIFSYSLLYNIPDKQGYYLPFYAIWLLFIALGLSKIVPKRFKVALFIFPLLNIILNYRICDLSRESSLDDLSTSIYESLVDNSIIISDDYFVYCSILNEALNRKKQIIPVAQFYLRMDWYTEQLSQTFPNIIIPERVDVLLLACQDELGAASKDEYGDISKAYCHRIQHEIINANIDQTPVYFFIYDDAIWPKSWFELYLESHGVFYQFHRDSIPPKDFNIISPSSTKYQIGKLTNPDAITVAKKFAAAYNRRGIIRFQTKQADAAISDFNKALEYYPDYYQVLANLGMAYLSMSDTLKTIKAWQKYLEVAEPGPQHNRIKSWYDQLTRP
ncbi:MAG: DUF2723 domain-containing protein [bacterium]